MSNIKLQKRLTSFQFAGIWQKVKNYPIFGFYQNLAYSADLSQKKLIEILFLKSLWFLDLLTCLCFASYAGYLVHKNSLDTGGSHWNLIFYDVLDYPLTFAAAIILRKRIIRMRSWVWLGIIGSAVRVSIIEIIYFPMMWKTTSHDNFAIVFFNWLGWAIGGLILIFTVRFMVYICLGFYNLCAGFIKNPEHNSAIR